MINAFPRFLLAFSAIILLVGGVMHASVFGKTVAAVATSNLPPFYGNSLKGLWLIDAATLITLAIVFGLLAGRPALVDKSVIILLAIIPAATACFLSKYIGNFRPAHMLLTAAAAAAGGALLLR